MEGSESEAIFDSLNLNPQLFINEALNTVDDLVDDAFSFYLQQVPTTLKAEGTDRFQDLSQGIARIRGIVQSVLEKRLAMWEKYCLNHCFSVPEGFSLPTNDEFCSDNSICQDALDNPDLDAKLDSLRSRLAAVGKESALLNREVQALERQSVSSNACIGFVNEALQLYEQNSSHEMFQDMVKTASELRERIGKLKTRKMEESKSIKMKKVYNSNQDFSWMNHGKGFSDDKLEDIRELLADMKNI